MTHERMDDELDRMLRARFEGPLADDGFSARVLQVLPPRPRRRRWPLPAALLAGAGLSLASMAPVLGHGGAAGRMLLAAALAGAMSVLAACWALEEGPD